MAILGVVATQPRLLGLVDENNSKITRFYLDYAPFWVAGTELEVATKSKGGHFFREDWGVSAGGNQDPDGIISPKNDLGNWGFSSEHALFGVKRYVDFLAEEKLIPETPYTFEVHLTGAKEKYSGWKPPVLTVTFDAKGVASFKEFEGLSVGSRPISLSATYTTGVLKAVIKLKPNVHGILEVSSETGSKAVTSTGFALPTGLSGWGGIEGGDVGWRLNRQ